jgi:hypothetical protein
MSLAVVCQRLLENPGQYLDKLPVFLWDEFEVSATKSTIVSAGR